MGTLKTLIGLLVMPLPLAAVLLLAGLLAVGLGRQRLGLTLLAAAPALVVVLAWAPVADRLLAPLEQRHPPVHDARDHPEAQAIVVLGSGYSPHLALPVTAQLNDSGLVRLNEGIRLHRQRPELPLIVSGGARPDQAPIAEGFRRAAIALGVADDRLLPLTEPRDTAQEAYATREVLGEGATVLLVTSASHIHRAQAHFHRAGLNPIPAPTRHKAGHVRPATPGYWIPSATHLRKSERALYEYMGLLAAGLDH
ncbi:YdcF family protein [Alkalilimnicola ehrlichii]|uniref:YdcF family protein n=1 Tax=Alkalilimnicola ehrlichii TaxID=351052 RepID=UPI003B9F4476